MDKNLVSPFTVSKYISVLIPCWFPASPLAAKPYPFYVSVDTVENHVTLIVNKLLHTYLGDRVNVSEDNCKNKDDGQQVQLIWNVGVDYCANIWAGNRIHVIMIKILLLHYAILSITTTFLLLVDHWSVIINLYTLNLKSVCRKLSVDVQRLFCTH